jgi:hypothetical protein
VSAPKTATTASPDELLDDAAATLDLGAPARIVGVEDLAHVLRVEVLSAGGEPDEVGEEHRDDLAFVARLVCLAIERAPQLSQYRAPAGLSWLQLEHRGTG